jgi:hypothetical protein
MLCDVVLATPNATWSRLQKGIGGTVGILPFTFGGLLATLAGIDPNLGQEIDGTAPAYAVLAGDPADPAYAVAAKLVDVRRARLAFVDAEGARFTARPGEGIVELVPKGIAPPVAVGLSNGGYLIVARSSEDLKALGPYAYRTLPARRVPARAVVANVPHGAIAGKLRERAAAAWGAFRADKTAQDERMRKEHGGRAPDFADPQSILGSLDQLVQKKLALAGDLSHASIEVDVGDDDVHVAATLVPERDGPASKVFRAMHVGDAAPLLGLDADAPAALLVRDAAVERQADAAELHAAVVAALGKRLGEAESTKLRGVLQDWAHGRGDWMTVSVATSPALGVVVRAPAQNAEAAGRAVLGAVELLRTPAFKEPLETHAHMRDLTIGAVEVPGFGRAQVATLARDEARPRTPARDAGAPTKEAAVDGGAAGPKHRVSIAWGTNGDQVRIALAEDAPPLLAAQPARTMRDLPFAKAALGKIDDASVVVALQGLKPDARAKAPVVVAWGRRDDAAVLRVSATHVALRDLIRKELGL